MRLHSGRILRLWENLEQLVVRQEVESWEGVPLGLEVLGQALLYLLQQFVALLQVVQQALVWAQWDHLGGERGGMMVVMIITNNWFLYLSINLYKHVNNVDAT